ncbi:MAG TPA: HAMP domain-containing sensor histidine kinase [Ktedonobacterales bacterium]|nr:HAMP domain-containing sensor histidine kinase [Ktedonobacterales bacterium]
MQPPADAERMTPPEPSPPLVAGTAPPANGPTGQAGQMDQSGERDERMAFLALAAHELRSPLTSVKGYAQLLLRGAASDPNTPASTTHALRTIEHQVSRMSDMVGTLLDASRIAAGEFTLRPAPADLRALVRHAVLRVAEHLDEFHELRLEEDGTDALAGEWDGPRVEQALRDLLDNAVRYSPAGGLVLVRLGRPGVVARLTVSDPGIGIPMDEQPHIFEPFFRGAIPFQRNLSGLGLGLYVAREIAARLGGRLWLESSATDGARHGSVFALDLPLRPSA